MIHEYALEPELVATWVDRSKGRYFIERFGIGQPRIVSRYPKRWKKLVWEASAAAASLTANGSKSWSRGSARRW